MRGNRKEIGLRLTDSRPIMSFTYCATWNKGVRQLLLLKLWPIIDTSVTSKDNDIYVRQTVAHTTSLCNRR